ILYAPFAYFLLGERRHWKSRAQVYALLLASLIVQGVALDGELLSWGPGTIAACAMLAVTTAFYVLQSIFYRHRRWRLDPVELTLYTGLINVAGAGLWFLAAHHADPTEMASAFASFPLVILFAYAALGLFNTV